MDPADADDVAATTDGEVAGTVTLPDGSEMPVALDAGLVDQAEANGVDPSTLADAATPDAGTVDLTAQTDGDDTATVPVQDYRRTDLTSRLKRQREYQFIEDDQIRRLIRNSVNYTERVGEFLLTEDDLIPTVKERLKALIVGEDGIEPEPADADSDADQRLADHLEELYGDEIRPTEVIDAILRENLMNARAVLRSTDLKELDLASLDYLRDGVTGEEIYVQDRTSVYTFDIDGDADDDADGTAEGVIPDIDLERETVDAQPLVIGDHVFDISLYDRPPLEAVADTAVNKMVLQRLKARKAEITSFGAVYASVEPPNYLDEDEYFDRVDPDDYDGDDTPPTKLERALQNNLQNAFDTLKDFQSGTVMAVPDFWNLQQLDIPETDDPIDDQIRGYNRDISRRLLVPLDLIELQSGSELSRETMFATLMTTIAGWRREITRVFDQFAGVHAEIEGIDGEVRHTFPPLKDANTKQIVSALQYAGVAGLSQQEVRQLLNTVQGIDLDTDDAPAAGPDGSTPQQPPEGGPDDPAERTEEMRNLLDEQRRGDTPESGQEPTAAAADGVDLSIPEAVQNNAQDALDARADDDTTVNGMNDAGWGTAETLAGGGTLSESKVVGSADSMANWWARHLDHTLDFTGDRITVASDDATDDNPWTDNSYTAGKGWGGVAGARFAFRKAAEITDDDSWRDHLERLEAALTAQESVQFGNVGGDPFGDQDTLEAFIGALLDAGADEVVVGDETWPDLSGIHDRPITAVGLAESDARAVWEAYEDEAVGLTGPSAVDDGDVEATRGDMGNVNPAGGDGRQRPHTRRTAAAGDGGPSGTAAKILRSVPFLPDPDGSDPVTITETNLKDWMAWVDAGRPDLEADWNPAAHPRGPDGQFIERPYDIPDDTADRIDDMATSDVLESLVDAGELSDGDLNALLTDDGVRIDGIPDSAETRDDLADLPRDGDSDGVQPGMSVDEIPGYEPRPALTKNGISQLQEDDIIDIDGDVGVVDQANEYFVSVDRGDGVEELPAIDHNISGIDTQSEDIPDAPVDVNLDEDTGPDGSTPTDPPGWASDMDFASPGDYPDIRPENADSVEALYESEEGETGAAASNMDVADFDNGETAFVKRHRETIDGSRTNGEKPTLAERAVAADQFLRNVGFDDAVPDIAIDDIPGGYMSSRKVDGEHLRGAPPSGSDDVDEDRFRRFAAAVLLAGNSDLHGDNVVVQDGGDFAAIDLNKSGGDFTSPGKFRTRGVNELVSNASKLGIDMSRDDLQAEAEQLAQEVDTESVLDGVPNSDLSDAPRHQFRDNIRTNIEGFANGEVNL